VKNNEEENVRKREKKEDKTAKNKEELSVR
jgi:hypothetical protein